MLPETPPSMNPRITHHPDGIYAVDAEYVRPGHAAVHILLQRGRAAFVDTGTNYSVPYLLAALESIGVAREAVDYVFLTHVHLDHAGGAGLLMQQLPNARAVLHPRGVPHMIDPSKLIAASTAIYGEESFHRLYGEILPIDPRRVVVAQDGDWHELAGRRLELIHTPGHALHHYVIVDSAHAAIFSGDTFGISYREFDTAQGAFITPAATPTQFDPDQLIASVDRLLAYHPESIYLMHYSRVTGIPRLGEMLKSQIRELVHIARTHAGTVGADRAIRAEMRQMWLTQLRRHGCTLPDGEIEEIMETDLELNTQGLLVWLERKRNN